MTKQCHVTLRLSEPEAKQIAEEAAAAGVSVSAWVRELLRQRGNLDQLAAELRSELADQTAEVVSKLKVVSDQVADLATVVIRRSAP